MTMGRSLYSVGILTIALALVACVEELPRSVSRTASKAELKRLNDANKQEHAENVLAAIENVEFHYVPSQTSQEMQSASLVIRADRKTHTYQLKVKSAQGQDIERSGVVDIISDSDDILSNLALENFGTAQTLVKGTYRDPPDSPEVDCIRLLPDADSSFAEHTQLNQGFYMFCQSSADVDSGKE